LPEDATLLEPDTSEEHLEEEESPEDLLLVSDVVFPLFTDREELFSSEDFVPPD
jgi:hypothetical protein